MGMCTKTNELVGVAGYGLMAGDPNANYEMVARLDEERRR